MAKKPNYTKDLLAETNPANLVNISIGSFLTFFVLLGSFITADAGMFVFTGKSTNLLLAGPYSPGVDGGYGDMTGESGVQGPIMGGDWSNPPEVPGYNPDAPMTEKELEDYYKDLQNASDKDEDTDQNAPQGNGGGTKPPIENENTTEGSDASIGGTGCLSATGC